MGWGNYTPRFLVQGDTRPYLPGELWESEAVVGEGRVIHQVPVEHVELVVRHDVLWGSTHWKPARFLMVASSAPPPAHPDFRAVLMGISLQSAPQESLTCRADRLSRLNHIPKPLRLILSPAPGSVLSNLHGSCM